MGFTRRMTHRCRIVLTILIVAGLAGVLVFAWCRQSRLYTVTVLPKFRLRMVTPCGLNDRGQIVGFCEGRFYLWERGKDWRELGRASEGLDINNAGQIAGTIDDPNDNPQAFLWDANEGLTILRVLAGAESVARALNNRGQIVGRCWNIPGGPRVFLWSKTQGVTFMGSPDSAPTTLNDAGQVIGSRGSREPWQAVLWEPAEDGSMTETLPPSRAFYDINSSGYVLGKAFNFDKRQLYGFIWRQDRDIEWLFPLENQMARVAALNDTNQVAVCGEAHSGWLERVTGRRFRPYRESFLWTREKGRVFLDGYVVQRRGEYLTIYDMNNRGDIVGEVGLPGRSQGARAVLLEPIPERWGR